MGFKTKLDYSSNRQINQREKTSTIFSGSTTFGLPFSGLTSGPDLTTVSVVDDLSGLSGTTFTGTDSTISFNFADSRLILGSDSIQPITPLNNTQSQSVLDVFEPSQSIVIDGNVVNTEYTGVSYTIHVETFEDLGGGNYSGTVEHSECYILSASTIDFSGRTIWIDNPEITRTDRLIVSRGANPGYVLTSDSEGMAHWGPVSGASTGNSLWVEGPGGPGSLQPISSTSAANGANSLSFGSSNDALGTHSFCYGLNNQSRGAYSTSSGLNNSAMGPASTAMGENTEAGGSNSISFGLNVVVNGPQSIGGGKGYDSSNNILVSGKSSFAFLEQTTNSGYVGVMGDNSVVLGGIDHNISLDGNRSAILGGSNNTVSSSVVNSVILGGSNITANNSDTTYVPDLIIDGLVSVSDLQTDVNGKLIDGASDISLKTNVKTLETALDKILNLRGVSFNWVESANMGEGENFGLIAQEVKEVIPNIVKSRVKDENHLTLDYKALIPWIIEAIKELTEPGSPLFNERIINSETITSEDNDLLLNYNGNHESALYGGLVINKGISNTEDSKFIINEDGDWVMNTYLLSEGLVVPEYTPTSSNDVSGRIGEITRDDDYIYIKCNDGQWKRSNLETF